MKNNNVNVSSSSSGGIGFVGLLTIVFIVLKLIGKITWSWWWVLSPLWISAGLALLILLGVLIFVLIACKDQKGLKNMERLTESVINIKERVELQAALNKLAAYEDAEEAGRLLIIPSEAYYVEERIIAGDIVKIECKHLLVEEGPDYEYEVTIEAYGKTYVGTLDKNIFFDREKAEVYYKKTNYVADF